MMGERCQWNRLKAFSYGRAEGGGLGAENQGEERPQYHSSQKAEQSFKDPGGARPKGGGNSSLDQSDLLNFTGFLIFRVLQEPLKKVESFPF